MLPIILLPVTIPLVLAAVRASRMVIDGRAMDEFLPWAAMLIAYDLVLVTVSYLSFGFIVED
jgi:heme exporter protein B